MAIDSSHANTPDPTGDPGSWPRRDNDRDETAQTVSLEELVNEVQQQVCPILEVIAWAEEEIGAAQQRHPDSADRIWRSFALLPPTWGLMSTEAVYRAHCRELLDRVAKDEDTRPGTAAECCIALSEASQRAPLTSTAAGLYARMWQRAGLPSTHLTDVSAHYEALHGSLIDEHAQWLRQHLRQDWRS